MTVEVSEKKCAKCGEIKDYSAFNRFARNKDGFHSYCRACRNESKRRWYSENREAVLLKQKEYRDSHRAQRAEYRRRHEESNPGAAYRSHKRWRSKRPEYYRETEARRRARRYGVLVEKLDYTEIARQRGDICHICGEQISSGDHEFEHIIPLSRGGSHTAGNVAIAHASCNSRKSNKMTIHDLSAADTVHALAIETHRASRELGQSAKVIIHPKHIGSIALSPDQARALAKWLIRAADASESKTADVRNRRKPLMLPEEWERTEGE